MAIFGKPVSDCMFAVIKLELSGKSVYGPVLKTTQLSAAISAFNRKLKVAKSVQFDPPLRPNFGLSPAYLGQVWGPLPQNG